MENFKKHILLSEKGIGIDLKNPIDENNRRIEKFLEEMDEREAARERYYNYLLSKRNWIERLLDIKPNMDFYDSQTLKLKP